MSIVLAIALISFFLTLSSCIERRDNVAPVVTIINPVAGDLLQGTVPVIVTAFDDRDIQTIRLFIDGQEVAAVENETVVTYNWDTTPQADNQRHFIAAYAIDKKDNVGPATTVTVTVRGETPVDSLAPTISLGNPVSGQVVSGTVNIVALAQPGQNNPIDSVTVFIDGTRTFSETVSPYIFPWDVSGLINGSSHTIFATAYDRAGFNISSPVITVTVSSDSVGNLTPPLVSIVHPIPGQVVSGMVNVIGEVDNIEHNPIDSVSFFIDGIKSFTSSSAPYIFPWDVTNLADGSSHTIFSTAHDQAGFNPSSDVISVTVSSNVVVDGTPPTVQFVYPDPTTPTSFSVAAISGITVVADAQDNVAIERVEFYIDGIFQAADTQGPLYEYAWDFTGYATGVDHTIYVRAIDTSGNTAAALTAVTLLP